MKSNTSLRRWTTVTEALSGDWTNARKRCKMPARFLPQAALTMSRIWRNLQPKVATLKDDLVRIVAELRET